MNELEQRALPIFMAALAMNSPEERTLYLDETCKDDPALRQRVEELLVAQEQTDDFLIPEWMEDEEILEGPGTIIGHYKLLEEIGEGGFGVVFMADQIEPIRRRVALKIVKPGMDTKQVVARFEAERQALALMDHPNIAHVFDAGATDSGRPYFVMEMVYGAPITQYCDNAKLTRDERIELFIPVCEAIQHAHQKGIIHRDLKPSNILVTLHDGIPVPKVIDFGTAKALQQPLTERTMFTSYGSFVGTPQYMSPEQAEMSGLDVDTRADIYSLGVLLYELLTGTTPFEAEQLRTMTLDKMMHMIREDDPPKPSTRVSTLGERGMNIAHYRKVDPKALRHSLQGDLDSIVMKALEKNRTRRYETANALAKDLQRYLNQELVIARPPSRVYRAQKSIRRHKRIFAASAAVGIALVLAGTTSAWLAWRATEASREAAQAAAQEKERRMAAESRTAMTRALNLFAEGNFEKAQEAAFSLPDDFIQREADPLTPLFRALGHWNAGGQRWKQCASCYDMFLLGPASRIAMRPEHKIGGVRGPDLSAGSINDLPFDIAYLEYGPVLVLLGEKKRYEQLCDAGVARYRDIERDTIHPVWYINDAGERMLHGCLLLPVQPRHRVAFCKWALLVRRVPESNLRVHHCTVLALFDFRRGNYREALEWAEKALPMAVADNTPPAEARAYVLLAMVHAGLNKQEEARKALDRAHELIDPKVADDWEMGEYGRLWADWLMARVLMNEAEGMLLQAASSPDISHDPKTQTGSPSWDEAMATASKELEGFGTMPAGANEGAGE